MKINPIQEKMLTLTGSIRSNTFSSSHVHVSLWHSRNGLFTEMERLFSSVEFALLSTLDQLSDQET